MNLKWRKTEYALVIIFIQNSLVIISYDLRNFLQNLDEAKFKEIAQPDLYFSYHVIYDYVIIVESYHVFSFLKWVC